MPDFHYFLIDNMLIKEQNCLLTVCQYKDNNLSLKSGVKGSSLFTVTLIQMQPASEKQSNIVNITRMSK